MAGLLDQNWMQRGMNNPLTHMGLGLMQSNAPMMSTELSDFNGRGIGAGLLSGAKSYNAHQGQQRERAQQEELMRQKQQEFALKQQEAQSKSDLAGNQQAGAMAYIRSLPEDQQQQALALFQGTQNLGDVQSRYDPAPPPPSVPSLLALGRELLPDGTAPQQIAAAAKVKGGIARAGATNLDLGYKTPVGFMADPDDPTGGVIPIPGGPKATQTPEAAAKTQMLESAIDSGVKFREMIMPSTDLFPEGKVDREMITTMTVGVPGSRGRTARVYIKDAIEAKLRAESGAAVPDNEVERAAERFMPSVLDNDETIKQKLSLLDTFLRGTLKKIDPTGAFSSPTPKGGLLESQAPNVSGGGLPQGMDPEDWKYMTPQEKAAFQ